MISVAPDTFNRDANFHGVKGMVFVGQKIVVFRRDEKTNHFPLQIDLPGGGREGQESPFQTFQREVMEEFGISLKKDDVLDSKRYQSIMDPTKEAYFIVTKHLNLKENDIVFGNEGIEFFLLSPQEFVDLKDGVERQQRKVSEFLNTSK